MQGLYALTLFLLLSFPLRASFECVIELPVYDQFGNLLSFTVRQVRPAGTKPGAAIDRRFRDSYRIASSGRAIEFDRVWLRSNGFIVQLSGPNGKAIEVNVPLGLCRYRQSTVHGNSEAYGDVAFSVATGRISGCRLDGDWWVRAVPLFGGGGFVGGFEGFVDRKTGHYSLAASFQGQRHLIVVGRGKEAVRTFAVNLTAAGDNTLPSVVLNSACK